MARVYSGRLGIPVLDDLRRAARRWRGSARQAATLDALAAVVILERWLTQPQSRHPLDTGSPAP